MRPANENRSKLSLVPFALLFILCARPPLPWTQAFARVVIQPAASTNPGESRLQILPSGDLIGHAVPAIALISLAYDVPDNPSARLSSLPAWAVTERFDIEAKPLASLKLDAEDLPVQRQVIQHLLRSLLANRFDLKLGAKTERVPVYALAVISGGPKLKKRRLSQASAFWTRHFGTRTGRDSIRSSTSGSIEGRPVWL